MKICFFLPAKPKGGFDAKLGGGSELALYYLTAQLSKMGVETHAVVLGDGEWDGEVDGVQVHTYRLPSNPLIAYLATKNTLGHLAAKHHFDFLVGFEMSVQWPKATVVDALVKVSTQTASKLVFYVGNHYPWLIPRTESNPRLLWRPLKKLVRHAHILMATSTVMARAVASEALLEPSQVRVVPFGVPVEEYAPAKPEERSGVVYVGRIIPHKGLRELVEAAHILAQSGKHYEFTVVGPRGKLWEDYPGEHYMELKALVERFGLDAAFTFRGSLPRGEVVKLLRRAKVFAFPTHAEGFGVALIEAMAAGVVPVVYPIEPITEIVGDAGIYCRLGDPASLAEGIVRAQLDRNLPAKVEERIQRFSITRVAQEFLETLETREPSRANTAHVEA